MVAFGLHFRAQKLTSDGDWGKTNAQQEDQVALEFSS